MTNDLERRLKQAASSTRSVVADMPTDAGRIHRRHVRGRTATVALGITVAMGTVGATALLRGPSPQGDSATEMSPLAPSTAESSAPTTTVQPVPVLPRFGITRAGWQPMEASDSQQSTISLYEQDAGDTAVIAVWSDDPVDPPGTAYRNALAAKAADGADLGVIDSVFRARAFRSGDAATTYQFLWQHTDTVTIEVVVFTGDLDTARAVLESVAPITEETWQNLLTNHKPAAVTTTTLPTETSARGGVAPDTQLTTTTTYGPSK